MQISLGIDPACLIISLIALWVAYKEIKRNRSVDLKILRFESTAGSDVAIDGGKPHIQLKMTIRNQGVALHDVRAYLTYWSDHGGRASIPFRPSPKCGSQSGEFSCGMVSLQEIATHQMSEEEMGFLLGLEDIWLQDPTIEIYSQGYLSKTIVIATRLEKAKYYWNQVVWYINAKLPMKRVKDKRTGKSYVKLRELPVFTLYCWPLDGFMRNLKSHYKRIATSGTGGLWEPPSKDSRQH